ncbi:retropepsin-like aspartic protease [Algoriphagus sp.]|uniref:retropepsin-like aspartic protease n=1 Tax=Algoriphagus sp. TaxID=1872435 RepID=UPI0025F2703C|nr:retropepsin-like aspartic protease [Algoriphagus sp.]
MKHIALFLLANLVYHFSFCQQLIDKTPFDLVDNLIFIQLKINNHPDPLNFMFDSGAGVTVIDTQIGDKLDLKISGETKIGTAGKTLTSKTSDKNQILIGERVKLNESSLYLMDLSHLSTFLKTNVDGIIGVDLLKNFITETNIDAGEMRFYFISGFNYHGNAEPIQLISLESDLFGIPIQILPKGAKESINLVVKIDTGASNYLTFHNNSVSENYLLKPKKRHKVSKGFSLDPTITSNVRGKVTFAKIGNKKWKNIPSVFEIDPVNEVSKRKADGLIGQELLLDFNILYYLKDGIVYLESREK